MKDRDLRKLIIFPKKRKWGGWLKSQGADRKETVVRSCEGAFPGLSSGKAFGNIVTSDNPQSASTPNECIILGEEILEM